MKTLCIIAHQAPHEEQPLSSPVVVATLTTDKRFVGNLNVHKALANLGAKCGLLDFEIISSDSAALPGHQLALPFPA